jgi:hypothetical protein
LAQEILAGQVLVETEDMRRVVVNAADVLTVLSRGKRRRADSRAPADDAIESVDDEITTAESVADDELPSLLEDEMSDEGANDWPQMDDGKAGGE